MRVSMEQKVYISYSRTDKEKVYEIKEWLERHTTASFIMCQHDVEGLPEQYVMDAIKGINECDVFLFMLSDNSQFSERPLMELAFACRKLSSSLKRVYIININACDIGDSFLFRWGNYRSFDWTNDDSKKQLTILLRPEIEQTVGILPKLHSVRRNGKYGFVNHKGEIVIQCKWTNVGEFCEGLAPVDDSSGKWGYLDMNGNRVIPCTWGEARPFEDGMAVVINKENRWHYKCGVIDRNDNLIIPPEYESLDYIGSGMFKYYRSNLGYSIIDIEREEIGHRIWSSVGYFYEGLCQVEDSEHKRGYIDRSGQNVIPCWWNGAGNFSEGLAVVYDKDLKYGVIDIHGTVVIPCYHDRLSEFHEGLCAFEKDKKIGFINRDDEVVLEAEWITDSFYFCGFHNGRFLVKNEEGKYGYIDKAGSLAIPFTWTRAEIFVDGTAWVKVDDTWKLIDTEGNYV
jgi:hypothetical protein